MISYWKDLDMDTYNLGLYENMTGNCRDVDEMDEALDLFEAM